VNKVRLRIATFFLDMAYHFAPKDREGRELKKAASDYVPPWHCHYICKGGWNVKLRDDCSHPRWPDGRTKNEGGWTISELLNALGCLCCALILVALVVGLIKWAFK
jgi:hypothetical protein